MNAPRTHNVHNPRQNAAEQQQEDKAVSQPRWANKDGAAQHIGVSTYTIDRLAKAGRITAHRLGRLVRYDLNELDAMLTSQETV